MMFQINKVKGMLIMTNIKHLVTEVFNIRADEMGVVENVLRKEILK